MDGSSTMKDMEDRIDDWILLEVKDGGYGKRPFRCECGMPLRFCHVVHHQKEEKTYELGETCLENYTMLSVDLIKDIRKGLHHIDLEKAAQRLD